MIEEVVIEARQMGIFGSVALQQLEEDV